jgi:hypothetical protein
MRAAPTALTLVTAAGIALALGACAKQGPGEPRVGGAPSYEVVTVQRPESVADYHRLYKAEYEMCATTRVEVLELPAPKPMLQPAPDYITQRDTYVSDGKSWLHKQEYFGYKLVDGDPTSGCDTYLEKSSNTQLIRDGKVYDASVGHDGKREGQPPQEWALPRGSGKEALYTEGKTVNGFAVKCMKMLPNSEKLLTERCIADLRPGTLSGPTGEPIVLSDRVPVVKDGMATMRTEPVTVKVGHQVDGAIFDAAATP